MSGLQFKIEQALQEDRILVLGNQVLVGFVFALPFQSGFATLPRTSQYLSIAALALLLITLVLLLLPVCYHQIAQKVRFSQYVHGFITKILEAALFLVVLALGIVLYIPVEQIVGFSAGILCGIGSSSLAFFLWYGVGIIMSKSERGRPQDSPVYDSETEQQDKQTDVDTRVEAVLMEARIVLPGLQALLGLQFIITIHEAFDRLPQFVKQIHLVSLLLVAVIIVLLMSPAAFHRIAESGRVTERVQQFTSGMIIGAMILFALGLCGDLFVVIFKVTGAPIFGAITGLIMLSMCYILWFWPGALSTIVLHFVHQ